jgi:LytS/YehU family sensor histidine kinase
MVVMGAWFNYARMADRKLKAVAKAAAWAVLGALLGLGAGFLTSPENVPQALEKLPLRIAEMFLVLALLVVVPTIVISMLRKRHYEKLTAALQREAERERLARELSESQLRLLRAQIEPHFLFNTLGAVQQLAEQGAPRAAELTANLIAFLRASLNEMRSEQATLNAEFGLVDAYLRVMKVRLGERLRFALTLPDALGQVTVPSMMLLTLVENSIKHGIEPSLHGGEVNVAAEAIDGMVRLRVHDSGVGMSVTPGAGVGLENVRHRLLLAYPGSASSLTLHEAEPGLIADILIPTGRVQQ